MHLSSTRTWIVLGWCVGLIACGDVPDDPALAEAGKGDGELKAGFAVTGEYDAGDNFFDCWHVAEPSSLVDLTINTDVLVTGSPSIERTFIPYVYVTYQTRSGDSASVWLTPVSGLELPSRRADGRFGARLLLATPPGRSTPAALRICITSHDRVDPYEQRRIDELRQPAGHPGRYEMRVDNVPLRSLDPRLTYAADADWWHGEPASLPLHRQHSDRGTLGFDLSNASVYVDHVRVDTVAPTGVPVLDGVPVSQHFIFDGKQHDLAPTEGAFVFVLQQAMRSVRLRFGADTERDLSLGAAEDVHVSAAQVMGLPLREVRGAMDLRRDWTDTTNNLASPFSELTW